MNFRTKRATELHVGHTFALYGACYRKGNRKQQCLPRAFEFRIRIPKNSEISQCFVSLRWLECYIRPVAMKQEIAELQFVTHSDKIPLGVNWCQAHFSLGL